MKKNRIQISPDHKKELAKLFKTTLPTVQMSLDYYNNSDLAKNIRKKAKALLYAEAEKIEI